jgi:hypothetical protein
VFENFERRRLRPGDVDINCVIAGGGLPVLLLQFLRVGHGESGVATSRRKRCRRTLFVDQLPHDTARVLSAFLKC